MTNKDSCGDQSTSRCSYHRTFAPSALEDASAFESFDLQASAFSLCLAPWPCTLCALCIAHSFLNVFCEINGKIEDAENERTLILRYSSSATSLLYFGHTGTREPNVRTALVQKTCCRTTNVANPETGGNAHKREHREPRSDGDHQREVHVLGRLACACCATGCVRD